MIKPVQSQTPQQSTSVSSAQAKEKTEAVDTSVNMRSTAGNIKNMKLPLGAGGPHFFTDSPPNASQADLTEKVAGKFI